MSTAVASPYLSSSSPTGMVQAEGWSNGAVLVDCVFAATLGQGVGGTPPTLVKLSVASASLDIFPTGSGAFTKFVIPFEHHEADVTVHFGDGTATASLPGSRLVMLLASSPSAGVYTAMFVSVTHDDFPNQSLLLVNMSDITIGPTGEEDPSPSAFGWIDYPGDSESDLVMDPLDVRMFSYTAPWDMPRDEPPPLTLPLSTGPRQDSRYFITLNEQGGGGITNTISTVRVAERAVVILTNHPDVAGPFTASRNIAIGTAGGAWSAQTQFARDYMAPWLGEG